MNNILILGAGKIGLLIATLLHQSGSYQITLIDKEFQVEALELLAEIPSIQSQELDVSDAVALKHLIQHARIDAVVSSLPFFLNKKIADISAEIGIHYFDLTEDTRVTAFIKSLGHKAKSALIPQCGLAPGFVGLAAYSLLDEFDQVEQVLLRVGAIPQHSNNALYYAMTWSTEGLINQYINPCHALIEGQQVQLKALGDYEILHINGEHYEAFNTSGGLGSLAELLEGKVQKLNYKTLRYVGHHEKIRFLLQDLKLSKQPELLKNILDNAVPHTTQDVVVLYVSIAGKKNGEFTEKTFFKKIYPQTICYREWSAIQVATASSLCAIIDLFFELKPHETGFIRQEEFKLADFLSNRFGQVFA
jgi:saccharopine dehydrogenase-like NADP-dependent oxidoreductase